MMNVEELKSVAVVGRALWVDPRESQLATVETLSAVTLLDLSPDRALERIAEALLDRVRRTGGAGSLGLGQPFFRLAPEDRVLLVALHSSRWSYARLSRIFHEPVERIEQRAWSARLQLAASERGRNYPAGAPLSGPNCPEYDAHKPWTQRFLDEEVRSGRDRLFLQNHLMACDSCREALSRCREVYYAIDRVLPRLNSEDGDDRWVQHLYRIARGGWNLRVPSERSFVETLEVFLRGKDVRWVLGGLSVLLMVMVWKALRN